MTHTIDDLWDKIDGIDNRLTILETTYTDHIEKGRRKRETIAYLISIGIGSFAILEFVL